ncbi:MAG: polymorphic toxin-type HINT domain-containing protein [Candidatus Babeliales bacterium]
MIYRKASLFLFFATFFICSRIKAGFIEGTLVKTSQGFVPIQELRIDDEVYAYDTRTEEFAIRSIVASNSHAISSLIHLQANGKHLFADAEQLFYLVLEKKWCCAKDLQPGMLMQSYHGQKILVEKVNELNVNSTVHEITLNEPHTFCVTGDGIVVHNFAFTIPILIFGAEGISLASGIGSALVSGVCAIICYKIIADTAGATVDPNLGVSQADFLGSQQQNINQTINYNAQAKHYSLAPDHSQATAKNTVFSSPKTSADLASSSFERYPGVHDTRSFPVPKLPIVNACEIPEKNKNGQEISTCPPPKEEELLPTLGCGQPQMPEPIISGECLPDVPEADRLQCPGIIGAWKPEDAQTSCNWSRSPQIPGLLDISPENDLQEDSGDSEDEAQVADDEITGQNDDVAPAKPKEKNQRQSKKNSRPWDLPNHDPAIDIEKIDFSEVPYLTQEEIELIKECIERFLEVEGFLANDGALWRILKFEDQKNGALFELEYISELTDQGSTIIKMGYEVKIQGEVIEIDIETDTELIECKSGTWELKEENYIKKLKKKLQLGKEHSKNLQKEFVVVSKKSIPTMWKNWFIENNINFREK